MTQSGYTAMPDGAWPVLLPLVQDRYRGSAWPEELVVTHLRWLVGERWCRRMATRDWPTVRDLAALFGWGKSRTAELLLDVEAWQDEGRRMSIEDLRGDRRRAPAGQPGGQVADTGGQVPDRSGQGPDSESGQTSVDHTSGGQERTGPGQERTGPGQDGDSCAITPRGPPLTLTMQERVGAHPPDGPALVTLGQQWTDSHQRVYATWRSTVPSGASAPEACPTKARTVVRAAVADHGVEDLELVFRWLTESPEEGATYFRARPDLQVLEVILDGRRIAGRVAAAKAWRAAGGRKAAQAGGGAGGPATSHDLAAARRRGEEEGRAWVALLPERPELLEQLDWSTEEWRAARTLRTEAEAEAFVDALVRAAGVQRRAHGRVL